MARKGYTTTAQQVAANKRYIENNEDARERRKRSNYKSNCKKFINDYATLEELKEIEFLIDQSVRALTAEEIGEGITRHGFTYEDHAESKESKE